MRAPPPEESMETIRRIPAGPCGRRFAFRKIDDYAISRGRFTRCRLCMPFKLADLNFLRSPRCSSFLHIACEFRGLPIGFPSPFRSRWFTTRSVRRHAYRPSLRRVDSSSFPLMPHPDGSQTKSRPPMVVFTVMIEILILWLLSSPSNDALTKVPLSWQDVLIFSHLLYIFLRAVIPLMFTTHYTHITHTVQNFSPDLLFPL